MRTIQVPLTIELNVGLMPPTLFLKTYVPRTYRRAGMIVTTHATTVPSFRCSCSLDNTVLEVIRTVFLTML